MGIQFIKEAADRGWQCLESLPAMPAPGGQKFSPESILALEGFLGRYCGSNWGKTGCPLSESEIQLQFGAYLGEVVRHSLLNGCQWNRDDITEGISGLILPTAIIVFPMEFIVQQIAAYQPGNLIRWCEAQAGLRTGVGAGTGAAFESAMASQ
jgi:hypothetical protein